MGFFSDVQETKAFQTAEQETMSAIAHVSKAVDALSQAVHALDIKGDYAVMWKKAVATFDAGTQDCKRNCDELAREVANHGRNTETANQNASQGYTKLAQAANGLDV